MKKLAENRLILVLIIILAVILILFAGGMLYMNSLDTAFDSSRTDTQIITIEAGSTTEDIGQQLEDAGIIEDAGKFKYYSKFKGYDSRYQAGTYALAPSMKLSEIAEIIISGKTNSMTFTIPEGYTIYQTAEKLSDEGLVDRSVFEDLLVSGKFDDDYDFLKKAQSGKNHLEGYLFPDTYTIEYGADEEAIIRIMLDHFDEVFSDEYESRAEEMGYSINDILTVASIIERECQVDDERAKVASVIYNRLDKGMALQMCSTVQYVLGKQKESLTDADTRIESPYNTYINEGLPPGPIACPGAASIRAALYPEDTDYLYFVVSEKLDGTQNFSSSYDQFLKDKDAYYKALEEAEE
ncbi:MAG: endolytic transglycosylase MltG [Emergencia sp.]